MAESSDPFATAREAAAELVAAARGLLDVEGAAAKLDPVGLGAAVGRAVTSIAAHPAALAAATLGYGTKAGQAVLAAMARGVGRDATGPTGPPASDRRYADPAWSSSAWYSLCREEHALLAGYLRELLDRAAVDAETRAKVEFAIEQLVDAIAPTNFPWSNPAVAKAALDTGGLSFARGARNMLRDVLSNGGRPQQTQPGTFRVGHELAATPGSVVFRNRLIEVIQYQPQTETVHEVPLLFSPPWINKYYIMDLAPGKSLVEWALRHGHTCFMISYRDPDEELRDVTMSDYLREGPLAALDVVQEITGADRVNIAALCLGGTLATATAAWLAAQGEQRINTLTLMNTLLDFSAPGQLGVFTDQKTVERLERSMRRTGYLPADSMKTTFDLLRANDLVWNYVVNNWMLGKEPAPFDLLTWNADSTRMPAAMQSEYLRTCYLENQLAKGKMELAGERLDLNEVRQAAYVISAEADHIAPWKAVYAGARLLGGEVRFVLSNSGHIAGVINPPSSKSKHWVEEPPGDGSAADGLGGDDLPADPVAWRAAATERSASWWEDWVPWMARHSGGQRTPPTVGSSANPPIEDAPGSYVRG